MVEIISVVIGDHFGGGDHFDGGDHFGGGTGHHLKKSSSLSVPLYILLDVKNMIYPHLFPVLFDCHRRN